jgi:hypothetical protein
VRAVDDLSAELILIGENLCRREMSAPEQAIAVSRRKAIYLQLHPDSRPTAEGGEGRHKETRRISGDESVAAAGRNGRRSGSRLHAFLRVD